MPIRNTYHQIRPYCLAIRPVMAVLGLVCCFSRPVMAQAGGPEEIDYQARFNPFMPTLVLKYEVTYRLFWIDLMHLADATVYATDGEWFNEATGEWLKGYLLSFHLDTLEAPSETGSGRYSIHNRLTSVLLKPSLEPIIFEKRDFMHVDTFFARSEVHNAELFSVESGKNEYIKKDFKANLVTTNMPHFAQLVSQRGEAFRFMRTINALYAGNTNNLYATNTFTISIYTDNAFVPFNVEIERRLRELDLLDNEYRAIYFEAEPAPGFSGKGRRLEVWAAPFPYVAGVRKDPALVWVAGKTFEMGMIPLKSEFGLKLGTVRCLLNQVNLANDW